MATKDSTENIAKLRALLERIIDGKPTTGEVTLHGVKITFTPETVKLEHEGKVYVFPEAKQ